MEDRLDNVTASLLLGTGVDSTYIESRLCWLRMRNLQNVLRSLQPLIIVTQSKDQRSSISSCRGRNNCPTKPVSNRTQIATSTTNQLMQIGQVETDLTEGYYSKTTLANAHACIVLCMQECAKCKRISLAIELGPAGMLPVLSTTGTSARGGFDPPPYGDASVLNIGGP
jgi:hypothetical protein